LNRKILIIGGVISLLAVFCIAGFIILQKIDRSIIVYDKELFEKYENYTLRQLAEECGIMIGTCVSYTPFKTDSKYREILAREFNVITPENELKFENIHPSRKSYNWRQVDEMVAFAEANRMKVRGHCLVWHNQNPAWILRGGYTKEEWLEILREHIYTVVGRYKGKIYAWDVVNEAFRDDGTLREESVWYRNIGPEYIELAFKWAHEADPDALLFYNDYGIETINRKSDAVYNLVKQLLEKGVPIHGIGMQMHISLENNPNPEDVIRNIRRFEALGLIVEITEMDVSMALPSDETKLQQQAQIYKDIMKAYLSSSKPNAFIMWGFIDKYSWILYRPGRGAPLVFDSNYNPKPAYYALKEAMIEKIASK